MNGEEYINYTLVGYYCYFSVYCCLHITSALTVTFFNPSILVDWLEAGNNVEN